jgi:hypothetical protein
VLESLELAGKILFVDVVPQQGFAQGLVEVSNGAEIAITA